jgi:hypothetical protein
LSFTATLHTMNDRLLLLVSCVLSLGLGGCGNSLWSDMGRQSAGSNRAREEVEPEGRALRVTLGGRAAYATLLQESGNRRLWRTGSGLVVATDGSRVVATAGTKEILAATRFEGPDPLADLSGLLVQQVPARRSVDLMAANLDASTMRFGVPVDCQMLASHTTDPGILLVEERCRAAGEGRFTNRFWVEAEGGVVLRAEQWIGPGVGMLGVEFL